MQVDIVTIGDELLIGQVIDTNSAWMGQELNKSGFFVHRITSVSDKEDEILSVLKETTSRSSIVLVTGGLGPTRDDITKAALCKFFNTQLVFNKDVFSDIEQFLKGRVSGINQLNRDQALVPEQCTVIRNSVGTAPIMWFNHPGGVVVSMPGVPSEMKTAMTNEIVPRLSAQFDTGVVRHKTVHVFNIPEAVLAEMLAQWEDAIPDFLKVAYLPSPGKLRLRLSGRGKDASAIDAAIDKAVSALYPIIGEHIFGYDDELPQTALMNILKQKNATIAFAESCSGGYLSHLMTSIPGASAVFKGGITAYSNEIKHTLLGVENGTLASYGAVSRQVVEEMAVGALMALQSDYAIATSGIAGPDGGSQEKPVGTVWIAWAANGKVTSRMFNFGNHRERTIIRTAEAAIIVLKQMIEIENF
ncbi:CinA family nicotinamide mononucleotide deamidase-related protein [Alkaliflexus imshenetskii]|uniref:CinA family nicotinamide mononucleotide deamidase-related protein n=1 Tax=Alkaliflexus imshenetskii TaxID=286730 RepID=UPI00047C66B1|nr:CinA family nicotinamide mononucleotide deamidase-related protein [Alkaliflexus imshenetskii]